MTGADSVFDHAPYPVRFMVCRDLLVIRALTALVLANSLQQGLAQDPVVDREYELKAVYLYHFCRYVEWPKNAVSGDDQRFIIGALGPNVFGNHLEKLAARTVNDKKIVIHHFASVKDYQPCHILFIASDDMADTRLAQAVEITRNAPVLLVSDTQGAARRGAVFSFFMEENKVKFEINPDAAKRVGLKISSQLSRLSQVKIVKDAAEGP